MIVKVCQRNNFMISNLNPIFHLNYTSSQIRVQFQVGQLSDRSCQLILQYNFIITIVQMSSYCNSYSQNCKYSCCDYYGNCPSYSSNCYYYYDNTAITAGAIAGIVIGIVFFIVFVVLVVYFCRRMRQRSMVPPPVVVAPPPTQVYIVQPNNDPNYYNPQYPPPYTNGGYQNNPYSGYNPNQPQNYQTGHYPNAGPQNQYTG